MQYVFVFEDGREWFEDFPERGLNAVPLTDGAYRTTAEKAIEKWQRFGPLPIHLAGPVVRRSTSCRVYRVHSQDGRAVRTKLYRVSVYLPVRPLLPEEFEARRREALGKLPPEHWEWISRSAEDLARSRWANTDDSRRPGAAFGRSYESQRETILAVHELASRLCQALGLEVEPLERQVCSLHEPVRISDHVMKWLPKSLLAPNPTLIPNERIPVARVGYMTDYQMALFFDPGPMPASTPGRIQVLLFDKYGRRVAEASSGQLEQEYRLRDETVEYAVSVYTQSGQFYSTLRHDTPPEVAQASVQSQSVSEIVPDGT